MNSIAARKFYSKGVHQVVLHLKELSNGMHFASHGETEAVLAFDVCNDSKSYSVRGCSWFRNKSESTP